VFGKRSEILPFSKAFRPMQRWGVALLTCMFLSFLLIHAFPSAAQSTKSQESATEKITRALSAGPPSITNDATVAEIDSEGGMKILRQGTNDFTCMLAILRASVRQRCVPTKLRCNGIATSNITKRSRVQLPPVSNTCWLEQRSVVTPTHSTRRARLSPLGRTG